MLPPPAQGEVPEQAASTPAAAPTTPSPAAAGKAAPAATPAEPAASATVEAASGPTKTPPQIAYVPPAKWEPVPSAAPLPETESRAPQAAAPAVVPKGAPARSGKVAKLPIPVAKPAAKAQGEASAEVVEAQRLLISLGYEPEATDGRMGARTLRAIRLFQQDAGFPADGRVSEALLQFMRKLAGRSDLAPATVASTSSAALPPQLAEKGPQPAPLAAPAAPAVPAVAPTTTAPLPSTKPASAPAVRPAEPSPMAMPAPSAVAPQLAAKPPASSGPRETRGPSINFAAGAADLTEQAKVALNQIAGTLKGNEKLRVQLYAYAAGSEAETGQARLLSLSRALAVRDYLMSLGVGTERVDIRVLGNKLADKGPADRVDPVVIAALPPQLAQAASQPPAAPAAPAMPAATPLTTAPLPLPKPAPAVAASPAPPPAPATAAKPTLSASATAVAEASAAPDAEPLPVPKPAPATSAAQPAPAPAARLPEPSPMALPAPSAVAPQLAAKPPASSGPSETRGPSINFAAGAADLTDQAKAALKAVAGTLKGNEKLRVQLYAYAAGSEAQSSQARLLSLSRALAVRDYLMSQGVGAERVDVRVLGNKLADKGPADRVDPVVIAK